MDIKQAQELAQRRKVRAELRELIDYGLSNREALTDISQSQYNEFRNKSNKIFESVSHAREMQLDSILLKENAIAVSGQASKLEDFSIKFDVLAFTQSLKRSYIDENDVFSWSKLGNDVGVLFRGIPEFTTMTGPLYRVPKARKIAERKQKDAEDLSKVKTSAATIKYDETDEKEATTTRKAKLKNVVETMSYNYNTQVELGERPNNGGIDLVRLLVLSSNFRLLQLILLNMDFLVDPQDPVQTVENIFDFSFLIKEKEVIMTGENGGNIPIAKLAIAGLINEEEQRQTVVAIDMKKLRKLSKMIEVINNKDKDDLGYSIQQSNSMSSSSASSTQYINVLHRDDEIYRAESAEEQTTIIAKRNLKNITNPGDLSNQKSGKKKSITVSRDNE